MSGRGVLAGKISDRRTETSYKAELERTILQYKKKSNATEFHTVNEAVT